MTHIDFLTKNYVYSVVGNRQLLNDYSGFFNRKMDCVYLLDYNKLKEHLGNDYYSIILHKLSPILYEDLKNNFSFKIKQNFAYKNVIYFIDDTFFSLSGHKYKKIRHALSYYKDYDIKLVINDYNFTDIKELAEEWKRVRESKLVFLNMGLERNYYDKYFDTKKNVVLKFYHKDKLIGYNVFENIDNNKFNLFFGRIDYDYNYFFYYMDYHTYKYIYENITGGAPYYLNSGCGIGSLIDYKTKCFPVYCIETLRDIKIL